MSDLMFCRTIDHGIYIKATRIVTPDNDSDNIYFYYHDDVVAIVSRITYTLQFEKLIDGDLFYYIIAK